MKKNYFVEVIKFLSAILVIFSHSFALSMNIKDPLANLTNGIISFGAIGVSVFFTISGYYIAKSITKKGSNNYIKKRLTRLLPSIVIVVLMCTFLIGPFITNLSIKDYFFNKQTYLYLLNSIFIPIHNLPGVFTKNIYGKTVNGALWTMSIQFMCYIYILIAFKIRLLNNKNKYLISSIALGIIAYIICNYIKMNTLLSAIRPFLVFIISNYLYLNNYKGKKEFLLLSILLLTIAIILKNEIVLNISLIILIPIIIIYLCNNINLKKIDKRIERIIICSYELYLVGFPIQQLVVHLYGGKMNTYLNFLISATISIILSLIINTLSTSFITKYKKDSI
ncbi:MAG: acyltransferase [Bacilli bacterium]|nr:acyltransferase [Bacilli bacterium]